MESLHDRQLFQLVRTAGSGSFGHASDELVHSTTAVKRPAGSPVQVPAYKRYTWRDRRWGKICAKMTSKTKKIVDRQVGRNAELLAQTIGTMETPELRYPYLRVLISIVELAHPEWTQAQQKDLRIAHLIRRLMGDRVSQEEITEIVRVRDAERGHFWPSQN